MNVGEKIIPVDIGTEMKSAYIDYSMSVIVSRALPDVRDGLKPVHRRVLFGMSGLGLVYNKAHKKSARIVGEVLGKYHPHGDSSVYDAMVRMAQDWSLRYPLVDGQGNFGSMDGDSPAAMRYTEARLTRISDEMLSDLDKNTVDFKLNFDDTLKEPTVLPSRIPNLLANGATGIAVGMATNMLPHNLTEVINGTIAYIGDNDIDTEGLMEYIKAPDFPTGGTIYGTSGVKEAFETGRGKVVVRGKAEIQTSPSGRETIVINEIPFQVNKANLIIKIADLVNEKRIEGISDIRDESDRKGLRIVVDVKRDANANVVLSKLYKYTPLQTSYGVNNIALVNGRPRLLNLKQIIAEFVKFRVEVVQRRTLFELNKAEARAHILKGILIALDYLDEVIKLIRSCKDGDEAKQRLMAGEFAKDKVVTLSELQAKAILDMRLQRLTGLERDKVIGEFDELMERINYFNSILNSEELQFDIIKEELIEMRDRYGDERRTDITFAEGEIRIEDMIANDEVVITISHLGYVKRTKSDEYRTQNRGGRGAKGSKTRNADFIEHMFVANVHDYLLLFTEKGRCHWLRVYEIPEANKTSSGRVMQNIIELPKDDKVKAYIVIKDLNDEAFLDNNFIMFCTRNGNVKKTQVRAFSRPRSNGINAITIREDDQLIEAKLTNGNSHVLIASHSGRAVHFMESNVRSMGRTASGVRGIRINSEGDYAVGMIIIDPAVEIKNILTISERGNGKQTLLENYRLTSRGGKGVKTMKVTEKTGQVVALKAVLDTDQVMIINKSGVVIRMAVSNLPVLGRATQGVRVIRIDGDDEIADVALVPGDGEDEDDENVNEYLNEATEDDSSVTEEE
ncbi:MAG: DNA gyrase subunit A [Cognaticolwellia sp.]|jgi:DNA gyrase subunit A